jgi:HD-GYP domain-containing protein (c-di-GMP phosphodiesterase class II)
MREIGVIVRSSHERWDGTGYPDGLAGATIPIESRVVTACDAFNAMMTDRSYRKALGLTEAIAELERNSGTQFDPDVVQAVLEVVSTPTDRAEALPPAATPTPPTDLPLAA